jgi:sortase A
VSFLPSWVLLLVGLWQLGAGLWIPAKAWLAQVLIARAWEMAMTESTEVRPWPWADTAPLARLLVPRLGVDQIVLAHATGRTLAFGPGHHDGSVPPGTPGLSVLSGHRDTHFRFLAELRRGDALELQRSDGSWRSFRVTATEVVDGEQAMLPRLTDGPARLLLATCYPFDAVLPGGPLRYIVLADAVAE